MIHNHNSYWSPLPAAAFLLTATLGIAATPVLALLLIYSTLRTPEVMNSQHDAPIKLPVWRWSLVAAIMCVAISTSADYLFSEGALQGMLETIQERYLLATPISRDFEFTFAGARLYLFGPLYLLVGDVLLYMAFLGVQHPKIGLKQRIIEVNSAAIGDTIGTMTLRTAVLLSPLLLSLLIVYSNDFRLSIASGLGIVWALGYPLLACISLSFTLAAAISAAQILNKVRTNGEQR